LKNLAILVICAALVAAIALAAGIDGKWYSEQKMERDGQSFVVKRTFDLKTQGDKLTGTVKVVFGDMEPPPMEIKDGKMDGNKFKFTTIANFNGNEMKSVYEGTVDGDTIKGTSVREGADPRPFEAKRK
jgi:hypothetical protein